MGNVRLVDLFPSGFTFKFKSWTLSQHEIVIRFHDGKLAGPLNFLLSYLVFLKPHVARTKSKRHGRGTVSLLSTSDEVSR